MSSHVPIDVVALSLLTAVLWGFTPILEKRGMSYGGTPLQASIVVVAVDSLIYWLLLVVVVGTNPLRGLTGWTLGLFVFSGVLGTAIGRLSSYAGMNRLGASVARAVAFTRPMFAAMVGITWLGEPATPAVIAGVTLIMFGIITIALSQGGDLDGWKRWELVFPLIAALAFGFSNALRRFGLTTTEATALQGVALNETAALVGLLAFAVAFRREQTFPFERSAVPRFGLSGILTGVALLSLFEALNRGRVSIVDPLYGTAPVFTVLFAHLMLDDLERVTKRVVVGAVLVVVGAVVLTM